MGTFSYTTDKKLSVGNFIGYKYTLTDVQTTGSVLRTPFKKIVGYLPTTTTPATSCINIATNADKSTSNPQAQLTFAADAESSGEILVLGLL